MRAPLTTLLRPLRDAHVAALLEAIAEEIDAGGEVEPEPLERDAEHRVLRRPPLDLPRRRDLRVTRAGRARHPRVRAEAPDPFPPASGRIGPDVGLQVAPFRWGEAEIRVLAGARRPNWRPFRLWFLDWLRPRLGPEAPELLGCVHAVAGPVAEEEVWRFIVDLGSAPVEAAAAMLEALARSGAAEIHLGWTDSYARDS